MVKLFWEKGYVFIGLNEILMESGVLKGFFYYYFLGGKEEFGVEVVKIVGGVVI